MDRIRTRYLVIGSGVAGLHTAWRASTHGDVVTTSPDTSVDDCGALMSSRRVRHLPVIDGTGLHGVVTIGDLLAHRVSEHETTIQHLNSYVFDMR
jgi:CBS domain-containing protein